MSRGPRVDEHAIAQRRCVRVAAACLVLFALAGGLFDTVPGVTTNVGNLTLGGGSLRMGGDAPGTASGGAVTLAGTYRVDGNGTTPGTGFDQLQVGDVATIAGGLQVSFQRAISPSLAGSADITSRVISKAASGSSA